MLDGYEALPEELKIYVPNFEYLLYDLSTYTDEEIKGQAQTKILLTLFRDIFTKNHDELLESILRSFQYLNELEDQKTGVEYLETMMRYIFSAAKDLTKKDVVKIIEHFERNYPEGSETAMSLADMWRDEGMEKGMEKGGTAALSEMAIRLLTKKFYTVPEEVRNAISKLDMVTLGVLIEDIFEFQTVDDVKKYIQ